MKKLLAFLIVIATSGASFAQMNVVKMNVAGIPIGNYVFAYERNLNENRSLSLTFAYLDKMQLHKKMKEADPALDALQVSGFSIMPELRFYPNEDKIMPRGGYVGIYGKYNSYSFETEFESSTFGTLVNYPLKGDYMAFGGGINFGIQWLIKDIVSIDWTIFGLHGGFSNSSATIIPDIVIPMADQVDIKNRVEEIDIPLNLGSAKAEVSATQADIDVDVIFLGLRTALSIGVAF